MKLLAEHLPGLLEIQAQAFDDGRGSFSETFNKRALSAFGVELDFVQDNESLSAAAGTVRGLHLQVDPHAQGKLVRVLHGSILDAALDLRPSSPTRFQHVCIELNAHDSRQLWIPPGFAHGFCTLTENTVVAYKVTALYEPHAERSIRFDDPDLGIDWPVDSADAVLSDKDAAAPSFADFLSEMS